MTPTPTEAYRPFDAVLVRYPMFAEARRATPAFYAPEIDHGVVTRDADVKSIFLDPGSFSAANTITPIHPLDDVARAILRSGGWRLTPALGNNDPPDHPRFRKTVHKAFTPRRVAELEPFIRETITRRVERFRPRGRADLMAELIFDVPALVILELVGVAGEHAPAIKAGSENRILFVWGRPSPDQQADLARGMVDFWGLLRELVDDRLAAPHDDLTSVLLEVRDGDDGVLSLDEIASVLFAFFTAGHETTASLIGNAVHQLLRHRASWEELCRAPELVPQAVEEILRYDTSVISWRRRATRATEIGSVSIPAGAQLLLLLGSANHDERVFDDPETLDLHRAGATRHLSFGHGIHHCLGAALARLEARIALEVLAERLAGLRLVEDQEIEVLPNTTFRGPRALHVEWDAR
jgi:cytochrome P450